MLESYNDLGNAFIKAERHYHLIYDAMQIFASTYTVS